MNGGSLEGELQPNAPDHAVKNSRDSRSVVGDKISITLKLLGRVLSVNVITLTFLSSPIVLCSFHAGV